MKKNNAADLWVSMRNKSGRTNSSNSELALFLRFPFCLATQKDRPLTNVMGGVCLYEINTRVTHLHHRDKL